MRSPPMTVASIRLLPAQNRVAFLRRPVAEVGAKTSLLFAGVYGAALKRATNKDEAKVTAEAAHRIGPAQSISSVPFFVSATWTSFSRKSRYDGYQSNAQRAQGTAQVCAAIFYIGSSATTPNKFPHRNKANI